MKYTVEALEKDNQIDRQHLLECVLKDASENVDADLVSYWMFNDDQSAIQCQLAYNALDQKFHNDGELKRESYPNYFKAIMTEKTLRANHVETHPSTTELFDDYFKPNGIKSLFDFIIERKDVHLGVICCESREKVREWSDEDVNYMRSLTTLTSYLLIE